MQQQQLIDPQFQSQSLNHFTRQPSRIKPLILRTTKESLLYGPSLSTEVIRRNKNLKKIKPVGHYHQNRRIDYIRKTSKILQTQNLLSELKYSIGKPEIFANRVFFSKIASSMLSQLSLTSVIAQYRLKSALKNLSYLKNLTRFNFELPYEVNEDPQALKILLLSIARLKKLRHLSIEISMNKDGKEITSYLARFSQLQSLELRIIGSKFSEYTSLLPNLPNLIRLSLNTQGNAKISSKDFLAFYQGFHHTKALTEFTLNLQSCSLSNPTDTDPLAEGLNALNSSLMQKLRLNLCHGIPIDGLIKITEAIKKFGNLQTFDLFIPYFQASKFTNPLSLALSELGSLKSLKVYLSASDKNEYAVFDMAEALESLQNLVCLELYFKKEDYTKDDEQINKFSSSLKKLQELQYLNLYFNWQGSRSDLIFESLSQGLKELINLKSISITFKGSTNKGVKAFCNTMKALKNLTVLALRLPYCEIDEGAIDEIALMLRGMPQLSDVCFSLDQCAKIKKNEKALKSLLRALKDLKNIKKINLSVNVSLFNREALDELRLEKGRTVIWTW